MSFSSSPVRRRRYDSDDEEVSHTPTTVSSVPLLLSSSSSSSLPSASGVVNIIQQPPSSSLSSSSTTTTVEETNGLSNEQKKNNPLPSSVHYSAPLYPSASKYTTASEPVSHDHHRGETKHHHHHHHHHHRSYRSRSRSRSPTKKHHNDETEHHHRHHRRHHHHHQHDSSPSHRNPDDNDQSTNKDEPSSSTTATTRTTTRNENQHFDKRNPSSYAEPVYIPSADGPTVDTYARISSDDAIVPVRSSTHIWAPNPPGVSTTDPSLLLSTGSKASATTNGKEPNSTSTSTKHDAPVRQEIAMSRVLSPHRDSSVDYQNNTTVSHPSHSLVSGTNSNSATTKYNTNNSLSTTDNPAPSSSSLIEKPNFGLSGILTKANSLPVPVVTNSKMGISTVLQNSNVANGTKYTEPSDARVPEKRWKLFIFKGNDEITPPILLHRRSLYILGRDHSTVDIPLDHPSCSKQQAVIQFRLVPLPQEPGDINPPRRTIKPYLLDLEATNGTQLNHQRIDSARYIELRSQDVLKFGQSSREYVLMAEDNEQNEQ